MKTPNSLSRFLLTLSLVILAPASAHGRPAGSGFQGTWSWGTYATRLDEIPPGYEAKKLSDVPRESLDLTIRQRGSRLSGEYGATSDFLGRVENGGFTARKRGGTVLLHLSSGFGGTITARMTRQGDLLLWQVTASHGEEYFPLKVTLHRVLRRKRKAAYIHQNSSVGNTRVHGTIGHNAPLPALEWE